MSDEELESVSNPISELKKRRREIITVFFVAVFFVLLTWFEIRLFGIAQQLPIVHSIFFFGLVNFNIILVLLLLFLIFRNIVKVFVERRGRIFGSSLKAKLVAAFASFSLIPTLLLLVISIFYINSSFEKWFSVKMAGVLRSSLEVNKAYYFDAKKKNFHFAHQIADDVRKLKNLQSIQNRLKKLQHLYALDAVEYYPSLFGRRQVYLSDEVNIPLIPPVSLQFLQKGVRESADASVIHQFGEGNLVRVIVPVAEGKNQGAIVVSSFVPLSLISKMNDISAAYDEFSDANPLQYPLKSIYVTILVLMSLVIMLAATWFGFHLAKNLAVPLVQLGRATKRVASGDYVQVDIRSGSEEISSLVDSFNQMTSNLANSEKEIHQANSNLRATLSSLDKHNRYIEVVLGNVSTGVISVDQKGVITTMNRRAGDLLQVGPESFIGRSVRDLLTLEYFRIFMELLRTMQENKVETLTKELKLNIKGEAIPLQMTLSILKDEKGNELGKVVVFDDMTPIVSAQRSAAWTEVARRIAHEIKNPLTPIKLSAERLQRKFGAEIADPAFKECTSMIVRQTEDLKNLVNEFSQFARLPQSRPVTGNVHTIIDEVRSLFSAHSGIEFKYSLEKSVPEFKFDPDQIRRVLVNLMDNAVSAVQDSEIKEISLSTNYDADLKILKIVLADSGAGIPQNIRSRVFEPYFSTKEGGTGLGLAIVKRIIEDHSGFIRALSNEPQGTRMLIELPITQADAWAPKA